jgi:hypothetical protein
MGKQQPTAPAAPDPVAIAGAQTASDEATANYQSHLNNGNSNGPYGSVSNTYDPTTNQWTQNTQLSPAEQAIFDQGTSATGAALGVANQQIGRVAGALDQPLNTPSLQSGVATGPIQSQFASGPGLQYGVQPGTIGGQQQLESWFSGGGSPPAAAPQQQHYTTPTGQTTPSGQAPGGAPAAPGAQPYATPGQSPPPGQPPQAGGSQASFYAPSGAYAPPGYPQGGGGNIQSQIGSQNINQSVGDTIGSQFAAQEALLQPQQQQAAEHQNAAMIAQGLNPNDAAYQNSQQLFNNQQAMQTAQVAANAVGAGNAEQNTLFGQQQAQGQFANQAQEQQYGQALSSGEFANQAAGQQFAQNQAQAGFGNTAQQQAYNEAQGNATLYNQSAQQGFQNTAYSQQLPINELTALLSSGQVQTPQVGQFGQTAVAPTDVTGAYALQQQQLNNNYQSQMQNYNAGLSGLFNLGSAAMMFA